MVGLPALTPVTTPVDETVASPILLLLHVPPVVVLARVVVEPTHTFTVPVIAAGAAFTVIGNTALQPPPIVYVIIAVPAPAPETMPVEAPIPAIEGALLDQVPPEVALVSGVVRPKQTLDAPEIAEGNALTVTLVTDKQPEGNV
jgi:hypothetical protein